MNYLTTIESTLGKEKKNNTKGFYLINVVMVLCEIFTLKIVMTQQSNFDEFCNNKVSRLWERRRK